MDATERDAFLARADALAGRLVARAAPVRFRAADTPAEREAIYRLRAETVLRRGWAPRDAFPDGVERDVFDDRAELIGGWDGDRLAATARLVYPTPGALLPTETAFDVAVEPAGEVVNLDRMAVAPAHSDADHRMMGALAFACWLAIRHHGYHRFVGVITPGVERLYRRAGWRVTPLGPPRRYWGEDRTPCLFDGAVGFATLARDGARRLEAARDD